MIIRDLNDCDEFYVEYVPLFLEDTLQVSRWETDVSTIVGVKVGEDTVYFYPDGWRTKPVIRKVLSWRVFYEFAEVMERFKRSIIEQFKVPSTYWDSTQSHILPIREIER